MRILVITGAGVSAESGIPTFRGPGGHWRNFDPAKLATPEAFARDPALVWEWYRERRDNIRKAEPNPAHRAIAKLSSRADDFLLVTQNVDDLHTRSSLEGGGSGKEIVQIHGDIFVTQCSQCDARYREREATIDGDNLPKCSECGAPMRPGVVWFGEQLDAANLHRVEQFLEGGPCDVVIVAGTTAMFAYITDWALRAKAPQGRLVEVNPDITPLTSFATESIREPAGVALPRIADLLCQKR